MTNSDTRSQKKEYMPRGFTELERELIRGRLLEQGYRQFSAYGLKKTTVAEIATAAGISKGAFYLFYQSKEALFMDVVEEKAEKRFRQEILGAIDLPGASPRARLLGVLRKAFSLFKTIPMLQFFTGSDYDLLFRRIPPEKLQQHLDADRAFFAEFIGRCQQAGIPIRVQPEEISALLYALVLSIVHEDDWGVSNVGEAIDVLLELIAAFCLGEIVLLSPDAIRPTPWLEEGARP
jgi:AcrR family transcriptional regulator